MRAVINSVALMLGGLCILATGCGDSGVGTGTDSAGADSDTTGGESTEGDANAAEETGDDTDATAEAAEEDTPEPPAIVRIAAAVPERAVKLVFVVNLDQNIHTVICGGGDKFLGKGIFGAGHDDKDAIGTP